MAKEWAKGIDRIVGVQGAFATVSASQVQLMQCAKKGTDCAPVASVKVAAGNVTAATGVTNETGDLREWVRHSCIWCNCMHG